LIFIASISMIFSRSPLS